MRVALLLSAALLVSTSCSDSTAPAIALTDEEVAQLFTELSSAAGDVSGGSASRLGNAGQTSAANLTSTTVATTADCVGGGTVGLNGTVTENNTTVSLDVTETFHTCKTETFTLGGSLRLIASINAPNDSTFALHETVRGVITATHIDGRSGACPIDVTVDLSINGDSSTSISANGTICGRNASVIVTSVTG